jgi:co-chaperonin GroES (HSP10)
MKSHNKILVKVEKHYDNTKVLKDASGKEMKILTDVEDGNNILQGDRNLEEYQKLCIGEIAFEIGSFSASEKLPYRSMDDKVHCWNTYNESDIRERLKVGTQVLFQHNLTMMEPFEVLDTEVYPATANMIHCTIDDGELNPIGGYILLDKLDDEKEIEKISSTIIIDPTMLDRHDHEKYYKWWGKMIKQSKPLKGDHYLKAEEGDLVYFMAKFAQTIIFEEKEYWLIMPSDAICIVPEKDFANVKLK